MFSDLLKTEIIIWTTEIIILVAFDMSSANALNLDQAKILSFGKGLMK